MSDKKHCFRCNSYHPLASFKRHHNCTDTSPIVTEVCKECYQNTINKIHSYNSEAKKHGGLSDLKVSQWLEKLRASNGYCYYCKDQYNLVDLSIDHMKPLSWGGDNSIENAVPACLPCNCSKKNRDIETWQRHTEASRLLKKLQEHLGLSQFETINLAVKRLAVYEGLITESTQEVTR